MPEDNGTHAGTTATTTATEGGTSTTTAETATYSPPQTQAELDRIVSDRLTREKAKYADYNDLKAKAKAHDEQVAATQTEAQKAEARATAAEKAAGVAATELARYKVAAVKGVPAELLAGDTEEEMTAHADRLLAFRSEKASGAASFDGGARTTAAGPQDMNEWIRGTRANR